MHSDREKLVERLQVRLKLKYAANCKCGSCQCVPIADLHEAIAALSEPVKDEPAAQWRVGEWGDGSTKPGEAVIFCDAHEAAVAAGVPSHLAKMIVEAHNDTVTRPAGERPAVAVEALREALEPFSDMAGELFARNWNASDVVIALDNPGDPHRVTAGDFFAARRALEQKP